MCYILSAVLIADIFRKRNISETKIFISGCIAGFVLELLAVRATGIYFYNQAFWLNIGTKPFQFPVFGGLMWGGLTVCALRIADRLKADRLTTALVTGWLIVTMDILLDVAAIRLDGGFWMWFGRDINLAVDHHMFMSVIWVNFLGYMFETPMITWLSLKNREMNEGSLKTILKQSVVNALAGIAFVGAASLLSLLFNNFTDEWFACIGFITVWLYVVTRTLLKMKGKKLHITGKGEVLATVFFMAMYVYCFAGLFSLGIFQQKPWYLLFGSICCAITLMAGFIETE